MLVYNDKQAPHEKMLIQQSLRTGRPYPKAIVDAPELDITEILYFRAFFELTTCRLFELGPIPYMAIKQYSNDLYLSEEQTECMLYVIRRIDDWYLNNEIAKINLRNKHGKRP